MKHWPSQIFPITLLALLAALSFWLQGMAELPEQPADSETRHRADSFVERFQIRRYTPDGLLQYRLTAPHMQYQGRTDHTVISAPQLAYLRTDAPPLTIFGERADVSARGETVFFNGNVRLLRAASATQGELVAKMSDLTIFPDKGTATTDSQVDVTQGRSWLKGLGLDLSDQAATITLRTQVSGALYPAGVQP